MENIAEKLELRDRVMRRVYLQMTPEERILRARQLHEWGLARLAANPAGYENFIRRNLTQRAIAGSHGV